MSAPWSVRAFAFSRNVSLWDSICSDKGQGRGAGGGWEEERRRGGGREAIAECHR